MPGTESELGFLCLALTHLNCSTPSLRCSCLLSESPSVGRCEQGTDSLPQPLSRSMATEAGSKEAGFLPPR